MTVNPVGVIRYQLDNHLGSASLELDETADIITYEEYHPFGTTSYRSGRTETETSQKRYKYVGKERDEETGLYYYGFRYYAAWLCRFVSVDPLQFDYPYYTPFQYAGNKPITYIDLDGLEEASPPLMENLQVKRDATRVEMPRIIPLKQLKSSQNNSYPNARVRAQIGPYNPEGYNKDFKEALNNKFKHEYEFNKRLLKLQQVNPLMFGNPGQPHGAGLISSLKAGMEVYSMIEGGIGLYKGGLNIYKGLSKLSFLKQAPKLSDELASTFAGGKYSGRILEKDLILYRAGEEGKSLGQFFSKNAPVSEIQVRIDKAILPVWEGGAESIINTGYIVKIPKGTAVYTGKIATQGGYYMGGTQQIVVQEPWLIKGVEVLGSFPLK